MKPLLLLLALSLVANAALLVRRSASGAPAKASASDAGAHRPAPSPAISDAADVSSRHALFWKKLDAADPSAVEQLRAAGWPPAAIRALVAAHVQSKFRARARALQPDAAKDQYWSSRAMYGGNAAQKAMRELWSEYNDQLKKLLGPDYPALQEEHAWRDQRFSMLPPEQAQAVREIEYDYATLMQEARGGFASGPTLTLPEDREKLLFLQKERLADLARTLTPEALFEYELRGSPQASVLRSSLDAFQPSEQEFRDIFRLRQEIEARFGYVETYGMLGAKEQKEREQLQAEMNAQIKEILSPERFSDYTRSQDHEYRRLHHLGQRLDLPASAVNAAYDVKGDIEQRLTEIRNSPHQDQEALRTALASAVEEAETQLKSILGPRAYDVYVENHGFIVGLRRAIPASPKPGAPAPASNLLRLAP